LGLVSACRFFAFLCEGNFVAFRREWILHVFAERECEQSCAAASRIIEFDLAKRWLKVMHGNVVQVVAVRIPGEITRIELVARDAMKLTVVDAPDIDGPKAVRIAQGESKVPTVLRPGVARQISAGIPGNLRD